MDKIAAGPVNKSRKRDDLATIADALHLQYPDKSTKDQLIKLINDHLGAHPALSQHPDFQKLTIYRPNRATSKKEIKNSADKTEEDSAEANRRQAASG